MKTRDNKSMVKLDFLFFAKLPFWVYILKNQPIHFWCMVIPLGPYLIYT